MLCSKIKRFMCSTDSGLTIHMYADKDSKYGTYVHADLMLIDLGKAEMPT